MGRIMGIDYGEKRCGVSATDTLQIAVHPVTAVPQTDLAAFIIEYISTEPVDKIVFGRPCHTDGTPTTLVPKMEKFIGTLSNELADISVDFQDESFTSVEASRILAQTAKKKVRKEKSKLDVLSAVLILQRYLNHI